MSCLDPDQTAPCCCCCCVPILITTFCPNFSGTDPWLQYRVLCIRPFRLRLQTLQILIRLLLVVVVVFRFSKQHSARTSAERIHGCNIGCCASVHSDCGCKHCRSWSDCSLGEVWSGSALFSHADIRSFWVNCSCQQISLLRYYKKAISINHTSDLYEINQWYLRHG